MEYAVFRLNGKQYKVSKGSIIEVDRIDVKKGEDAVFDNVLLVVSDGKVRIGTPIVPNAKVKAHVLDHKKGEKIRVAKFKAKVRYRRVIGFRPQLTRLEITNIDLGESQKKETPQSVLPKAPAEKQVRKVTRKTLKKT